MFHDNDPIDLMIVMEKPEREDLKARNIGYGRNIHQLAEFVNQAGIDPRRVFFTTLTKCYSFQGRPTLQDIKACIPHTIYDIESLKPKAIMLLGTAPLRLFRLHNQGGINSIRGKIFHVSRPRS
jgi:uracil-DNA glycosylase family 4